MAHNGKQKRVALLGAGYIADYHARGVQAALGRAPVAVCDIDAAQAEKLAGAHGIRASYTSLEQMLASEQLDVVHVLLPPQFHADAGATLLQHGIDVLFEKPFATTESACRTLSDLARERGKAVGTSHNFLFSEVYEKLRTVLREGRLGQIDEIEIVWNKFLPQARFGPFSAWMLRAPGNIMLEVGPHSVAHLLDLLPTAEISDVRIGRPLALPGGGSFYERWTVTAEAKGARAELRFSLIEGYTEHRIHLRGTLASATVDFERDTFQIHHHRPLGVDFDRFAGIAAESAQALVQGSGTLARYALTKAKVLSVGGPFQASLTRSIAAFYANLPRVDERHAPELATRIIALGERIAAAAPADARPQKKAAAVNELSSQADVLVTGATGFIGRELVRQLVTAGMKVRIVTRGSGALPSPLDSLPVEIASGKLTDPDFVRRALQGVKHVVHLARSQGTSWKEFERDDVEVTKSLALAACAAGVQRFVYASSIVIYYAGASAETIRDETPPDPAISDNQAYARAKVVTERLLTELAHREKLPLVIVRPGIVLGTGGNPRHWGIGMWPHHSVCITWGAGNTQLPVVLVEDVADGIARCLTVDGIEGESFNFVGDATLTAREYLDAFEAAAGVRLERRVGRTPALYANELAKWAVKVLARYPDRNRPSYRASESRTAAAPFDCGKAKRLLGWRPTAERERLIESGIRRPVKEFLG